MTAVSAIPRCGPHRAGWPGVGASSLGGADAPVASRRLSDSAEAFDRALIHRLRSLADVRAGARHKATVDIVSINEWL
jgi:hypothetical protein